MNLEHKVCLITGGTKGIGAATALLFARSGSDIAVNGRQVSKAGHDIKKEIESMGRRCHFIAADVGKPEEAVRCAQEAILAFGGVDVLVHCAGVAVLGGLLETTPELWHRTFDLHVHGLFHLCREVVPHMKRKKEGTIIMVSSGAGLRGCPNAIAYAVAKGALPQFARALARELAADNIRVNCVAPGIIRTSFQEHLTPEQVRNNVENRIPLHREGRPEEVAQVIELLVKNDFITGETITIDGGMAMRMA
jgi:NAD(P)-dependent dehydrogenase (short-subunit alcohol dehydrogenase family)